MSLKADGGKSLNVRPNLLVVPPSLEGKARSLILKDKDAGNPWYGTCEILVSPWLL
jgi:phage major head subunit gpT-like protein